MLGILVDIIIPADDVSGSANDAEVVDFINSWLKIIHHFKCHYVVG